MNAGEVNTETVVVAAAKVTTAILGEIDGLSLLAISVVGKAVSPATVSSQEEEHTGSGTTVATQTTVVNFQE